jgi:hypothetical protein
LDPLAGRPPGRAPPGNPLSPSIESEKTPQNHPWEGPRGSNMTQNRSYFDPLFGPPPNRTSQIKGRKSPDLGPFGSKRVKKGPQKGSYFDPFWVILGSFWVILDQNRPKSVILAFLVNMGIYGHRGSYTSYGTHLLWAQMAQMTQNDQNDPFWPSLARDPQNDPK